MPFAYPMDRFRLLVTISVVSSVLCIGCSQRPAEKPSAPAPRPLPSPSVAKPSVPPTFSMGNPKAKAHLEAFYPLDKNHAWVMDWLHQAGDEYGDQLFVRAYDITTAPGIEEWHKRGLKCGGLLINDKSCFDVGKKQVHFLRNPGHDSWTKEQFFAVLHHEVEQANMNFTFQGPSKGTGKTAPLFMFSGAGLREPIEAVRDAFEKQTGVAVRVCYAGSACLLAQIEITHRGDLYFPGETYYVDQARKRGFIETSQVLCYMIPVIMVAKGNPKGIHRLADLSKPGLRIGIGEPRSCAVGKTSEQLLRKHKLYQQVGANIVMHTATAPELGNAMKLSSIDAAINWDAVAAWYEDACDVVTIPPRDNLIVQCPLAVLKFSKAKSVAEQFLQFAAGPQGQELFKEKRYTIDLKHPVFPG